MILEPTPTQDLPDISAPYPFQTIVRLHAKCGRANRTGPPHSSFAEVVRVRYILPNVADFEPCWPVLRQHFGEVRPAATMIAAGLADPRMKIEIEVTARRMTGTDTRP